MADQFKAGDRVRLTTREPSGWSAEYGGEMFGQTGEVVDSFYAPEDSLERCAVRYLGDRYPVRFYRACDLTLADITAHAELTAAEEAPRG